MRKGKKALSLGLVSLMTAALVAGCGNSIQQPTSSLSKAPASSSSAASSSTASTEDLLKFEKGTELRMATGYNSAKTGIVFDAETAGAGVTLADGKNYNSGDLKPTWVALQDKLGMKFTSVYQGNSSTKEFDYWKEKLGDVDMVSGTAAKLTEFGEQGSIVNIGEYLDKMPNFKAYLDKNPIVRLSITGNVSTGAIYFSPYFDGVNDIEKMPLMRTDWVAKLLDGEGQFSAAASGNTATPVYQPFMPTSGKVEIDVVKKDGKSTEKVTKDYGAYGNIVAKMNEKGSMSGVDAVNMLREYIDKTYNNYYGTTRSDLFCGQNAAWDVDELVALVRCVVSNAQTLNGTDKVQGIFTREDNNLQRKTDMVRFAGVLFGVRGLESRQDYLYVGNDGKLHDARQETATYDALKRMNDMVKEGLISEAFINNQEENTKKYLENDLGFMHYDYNQTQTIYNQPEDSKTLQAGEKYMAVMVPVSKWNDGKSDTFMRFTESWRSVKTDGWGISKAGVGNDTNKLNACLKLIDYAYSPEGTILMSYGPDAFIKKGETFNFNGEEMPVIADATRAELWDKAKGNYTNYARMYLGSTLSFMKSQAFEYQCTTEVGREGAGYISNAIALGTIKHPELALASNMWYTSVPTVLPTTKADNDLINSYTNLTKQFSSSKGDDQVNVMVDLIAKGSAQGFSGADTVKNDYQGASYLQVKEQAWEELQDFYKNLK
ncbi:MAG: hypothetical protein IJI65_00290 [Lachnospiraceae bacterium]|nr:hypothetical protein [Lachnospiraceae bacterium]